MLETLRRISGNLYADDVMNFEEDFIGAINNALWNLVNSLTGSQSVVSGAGGLRRMQSGLTLLGASKISFPASTFIVRPDRLPILEGRVRLAPTGSLGSLFFEWGFGDSSTGVVFQFDQSVNANWRAISRSGGTTTTTTTSIAASANQFVKLRLVVSASSVGFSINDALVATHTTNLPSATGYYDLVAGYLQTLTTLINVSADIDYIRVRSLREP